jgi:two-component system NarL family sensor kinase
MDSFARNVFWMFLFLTMMSCSKTEQENHAQKSVITYLNKHTNLSQEHYKDSFLLHFNQSVQNQDIDFGIALLDAFANSLDLNLKSDSLFVQTCENFLARNESKLTNIQKMKLQYSLGSQYDFLGDLEKSKFYLQKNRTKVKDKEEIKLRAFAGELLSIQNKQNGKFHEALILALENIADFEKLNDSVNLAISYSNASNIYTNLKNYQASEQYILKSLEISLKINDTINIWTAYVNLSRPNTLEIKPKKCLHYASKAKSIENKWKESTNYYKAFTNSTYARALMLNQKFDSVPFYISETKKYYNNQNRIKFDLLSMEAELIQREGKPIENIEIFENEYLEAKKKNDVAVVEMLASILSKDAKIKKNYQKALSIIEEKYAIRDSAWMLDTKHNLAYLDKKFQVERKEKLISQQKLQITQTNTLVYIVISAFVFLVLIWILVSIYKKKKQSHSESLRQERFTFQLLQSTEEERSRIANELHDSVNHELLHIKNNLIHGNTISVYDIGNVIEEVRNISRNLHPVVLEKIGLEASIESLCERVSEIGLFTTYEINYDKKLSKSKELQLYRIVQEALNNTLKHGKANAAKVILCSENNYLHLVVKDNGNGFDVNQQLENPKSFGLQSMMQRAKAIAGIININSNEEGTQISIQIPT